MSPLPREPQQQLDMAITRLGYAVKVLGVFVVLLIGAVIFYIVRKG